jgi:hypothetical protein
MPGIFFTRGAQLRIPGGAIKIRMTDDGPAVDPEPVQPELRMDLWPHWLHEALDATVAARAVHADLVAEATTNGSGEPLARLLDLELRTCMRAISSAAFAVDAFYASVQARSPAHSDQVPLHPLRNGQRRNRGRNRSRPWRGRRRAHVGCAHHPRSARGVRRGCRDRQTDGGLRLRGLG